MVKIKVEKNMNLLELIDWAWKNGVKEKAFYSNIDGGSLYFDMAQTVSIEHLITKDETFTVEVEEEITQETKLPKCLEIYFDDKVAKADEINVYMDKSIGEILQESKIYQFKTKAIYLFGDNGNLTPIWKDGELVGDE